MKADTLNALKTLISDANIELVVGLSGAALLLVGIAIVLEFGIRSLRHELDSAEEELVDEKTGLLPKSAVSVRLGAELQWAQATNTALSIAVLKIRGARFTEAAKVLRSSMRGEEQGFLLGDQKVLVELWETNETEAVTATQRIGAALAEAGFPVVDGGIASAPRDGYEISDLIDIAEDDLRPVDDPSPPGTEVSLDSKAVSSAVRTRRLLAWVLPWFALQIVMLSTAWKLIPAAIDISARGMSIGSTLSDITIMLVTLIGLPAAAALSHYAAWNLGGGRAPSSVPHGSITALSAAVVMFAIGIPLAIGVLIQEKQDTSLFASHTGVVMAMFVLIVIVLLHARQLVAAKHVPLIMMLLLGVGALIAISELTDFALLSNAFRLFVAAVIGSTLARIVERESWMVVLVLSTAAIDLWSVISKSGVSSTLLSHTPNGSANDLVGKFVDLLLFTGPSVNGVPIFEIGLTDLVFLALFISWAHDWRIDMRLVASVLVLSLWSVVLVALVSEKAVPVLPGLGAGMLVILLMRFFNLRTRGRAYRRELKDSALEFPTSG